MRRIARTLLVLADVLTGAWLGALSRAVSIYEATDLEPSPSSDVSSTSEVIQGSQTEDGDDEEKGDEEPRNHPHDIVLFVFPEDREAEHAYQLVSLSVPHDYMEEGENVHLRRVIRAVETIRSSGEDGEEVEVEDE